MPEAAGLHLSPDPVPVQHFPIKDQGLRIKDQGPSPSPTLPHHRPRIKHQGSRIQSQFNTSPSRIMINLPLLLLLMSSSGVQAFHLTHIPTVATRPLLPLFPFYYLPRFSLLQGRTDDLLHEFRHTVSFFLHHSVILLFRCPGPGSFPSSSDCSHFWECLGEDQVEFERRKRKS